MLNTACTQLVRMWKGQVGLGECGPVSGTGWTASPLPVCSYSERAGWSGCGLTADPPPLCPYSVENALVPLLGKGAGLNECGLTACPLPLYSVENAPAGIDPSQSVQSGRAPGTAPTSQSVQSGRAPGTAPTSQSVQSGQVLGTAPADQGQSVKLGLAPHGWILCACELCWWSPRASGVSPCENRPWLDSVRLRAAVVVPEGEWSVALREPPMAGFCALASGAGGPRGRVECRLARTAHD